MVVHSATSVRLFYCNLVLATPTHQPDDEISAYTYERTLVMEQRNDMLKKMRLTERESRHEACLPSSFFFVVVTSLPSLIRDPCCCVRVHVGTAAHLQVIHEKVSFPASRKDGHVEAVAGTPCWQGRLLSGLSHDLA